MSILDDVPYKPACPRTSASLVLLEKHAPSVPMKMLSKQNIHDFVCHSSWMEDAKKFVAKRPDISLRELQDYIVELSKNNPEDAKYNNASLWMYDRTSFVIRTIYEDAAGLYFVKHDNVWKVVFPIDRFGSLISSRYKLLAPITGYFCPSLHNHSRPHTMW